MKSKRRNEMVKNIIANIKGIGLDYEIGYYQLSELYVSGEEIAAHINVQKEKDESTKKLYYAIYYTLGYKDGDSIFSNYKYTKSATQEELVRILKELEEYFKSDGCKMDIVKEISKLKDPIKFILNGNVISMIGLVDNGEDEVFAMADNEDSQEMIALESFRHYDYKEQPLYFVKQSLSYEQQYQLISKFDEWYGNTNQETTVWALEFQLVIRMILCQYLVVNPKHLIIEEVLKEICEILNNKKQVKY